MRLWVVTEEARRLFGFVRDVGEEVVDDDDDDDEDKGVMRDCELSGRSAAYHQYRILPGNPIECTDG